MSGLGSRLFRGIGFWGGRVMLSRFEKTSRRAVAANRSTLAKILEANTQTEFGRRYRFGALIADGSGADFLFLPGTNDVCVGSAESVISDDCETTTGLNPPVP